ncbi:hypothetical protein [Labedaea rhizosphaerae]|uniref:DUF2188 domain-containing protein n=1 Tax=Labedaea rhizosphaerae TaxID=598644 RepID=A0A4R6SFF4_LABRH|nr:hypothetical protein [Labedaea rhizosphaerae]TDP97925.1 hypothetical protein EV186_103904 [Labedaea rhizosphaerae]
MDPIQAEYERDGDDWTIKVSTGEKSLTGQAPGLIAARDRADQLVEKLVPGVEHPTVVHLLNGDALEFTTAYLNARLAPAEKVPAQATSPEKPSPKPVPSPPKKKEKEADQAKEAQPAPPA